MTTVYWIFWLTSLLIFVLTYCLASCKYKALPDGRSVFPNIEYSKVNPKLRKKIPVKIWHVVLAFILLWIPIVNIFASILFLANATPDKCNYEFILSKENKTVNIFAKIGNFLNRDISW